MGEPRRTKVTIKGFLIWNFLLICLLFQVFLITKATFLYPVLKVLFVLEVLGLIAAFVRASLKEKAVLLALVLIIGIRIPFYAQGDGLLLHSDNALDALQAFETQHSHTAPFFLLDSSSHNGTLKYLFVACVWDFFGTSYLGFVLVQLGIFLVFIFLLYEIFRRLLDEKVVLLFLFVHFAFIEVIFDYSLFLRAAPYLEMLTVFLLGVSLFDFSFTDKLRLVQAWFFVLFSSYLHPLVVFLIIPFGLTAVLISLRKKKLWPALATLLAGGVLGAYHLVYYRLAGPTPPPSGEWYRIIFFSPSQFSLAKVPEYLQALGRDLWTAFHNLFDFEFLYSLQFFEATGPAARLLRAMNRSIIFLSAAVALVAVVVSCRKLWLWLKKKSDAEIWPSLFYVLTFLVLVGKAFALSPRPFAEPRHNMDMALWVAIGYLIVFSAFLPLRKVLSVRFVALALLFFALTVPHYVYYLKIAQFKKESYQEIIPLLTAKRVRYLATDFSLAYPVYFLTHQKIEVSDSLGPVTVSFFYPWLRERVDKVPWQEKAYLFFGDAYYRGNQRAWHREMTHNVRQRILQRLQKEDVPYTVHKLANYTIIIPKPAAGADG